MFRINFLKSLLLVFQFFLFPKHLLFLNQNVLKIKKDLNAKHQNLFVDGLQKLEFVTIVFGKQLMSAIKELLLN